MWPTFWSTCTFCQVYHLWTHRYKSSEDLHQTKPQKDSILKSSICLATQWLPSVMKMYHTGTKLTCSSGCMCSSAGWPLECLDGAQWPSPGSTHSCRTRQCRCGRCGLEHCERAWHRRDCLSCLMLPAPDRDLNPPTAQSYFLRAWPPAPRYIRFRYRTTIYVLFHATFTQNFFLYTALC